MIARIIAWSLAFALAAFPAFAQQPVLPGFPPGVFPTFVTPAASAPVGPPTFTFESSEVASNSFPSFDVSFSMPFNVASPFSTRFAAVSVQIYNANGGTLSSVEFNGSNVSFVKTGHNVSQGTEQLFAWGVVPTGTSLTVDVIYTGQQISCCVTGMFMWSADSTQFQSLTPVTSFADAISDPSVTGTVNVLNGGAVLAFQSEFGGTSNSFSFTSPNTPPVVQDLNANNAMVGHANNISPAQSPASVTVQWSGSVSGVAVDLSLAAWR